MRFVSSISVFTCFVLATAAAPALARHRDAEWRHFAVPACGDLRAVQDTRPEAVVRWLDAYFLELAAVFPESTQRLARAVYFHSAYVHTPEGLALRTGKVARAELVNTGSEVVPYVEVDEAIARVPLLRRSVLLPAVLGVLAAEHAETERLGVAAAYRRNGRDLSRWTELATLAIEARLHAALADVHWDEAFASVVDDDARRVFERRRDRVLLADDWSQVFLRKDAVRRHRVPRRVVRAFERRLAAAESERPCRVPERVEIPKVEAKALPAVTELPVASRRTALETLRSR